ncbi:MAG: multidrug ABC transporter permease, partial [Microbacteriaceae bacterium]
MTNSLVGTPPLLKATMEHEGRSFAPWVAIVTALSVSSVLIYPWIFPTLADRTGLATAIGSNPAVGLVFGPAFDLSTTDGFNAWRSLAIGGFLAALGAIFAVTRASRAQEDSGQAELLASGVMGRGTRLFAAVALALIGSLLIGVVSSVLTALCGGGWEESLLLGATFTATGWMFAAIAAITAQIGSEARTSNSIAVAVLGTLFVLRGFSYSVSAPEWTIWVNPLGWMTETHPASGNHWWPLLLALTLTIVLLVVAFVLQSRRDFAQGAISPPPGKSRGKIRSSWGLVLRINRGPLLSWAIAFLGLGLVFGYFATAINDILGSDSAVKQFLAAGATTSGALISAFLVMILNLLGIISSISGVQIMIKMRGEEIEDRVEPVLAGSIARSRCFAGNVLLAFVAPAIYLLIAGTVIAALASTADIGVEFN